MDKREARAEHRLIKELISLGFIAKHMNTDIDGFHDILAIRGNFTALIEMKACSMESKIDSALESSQPAWHRSLETHGFTHSFICVWDDIFKDFFLYRFEHIGELVMCHEDDRFCDYTYIAGPHAYSAVNYIHLMSLGTIQERSSKRRKV